jgi:hypothetical protein
MRINVVKRSRKLEKISDGDILIFPDREETVKEVDNLTGALYTERPNNSEKGWIKTESVAYSNIEKVHAGSVGHVYDWVKRRLIA